jgi:hypothetical protein
MIFQGFSKQCPTGSGGHFSEVSEKCHFSQNCEKSSCLPEFRHAIPVLKSARSEAR